MLPRASLVETENSNFFPCVSLPLSPIFSLTLSLAFTHPWHKPTHHTPKEWETRWSRMHARASMHCMHVNQWPTFSFFGCYFPWPYQNHVRLWFSPRQREIVLTSVEIILLTGRVMSSLFLHKKPVDIRLQVRHKAEQGCGSADVQKKYKMI